MNTEVMQKGRPDDGTGRRKSAFMAASYAAIAASSALSASVALAQQGAAGAMDRLGGGLTGAVCGFLGSNIVVALAAISLLVLIVLWMIGESREFMGTLLKIAFAIAMILNLGTILTIFGMNPIC